MSDDLLPPHRPFSSASSRRSSFSSDRKTSTTPRPASLSINFVPAKFTKPHAPGRWAHRRTKQGGGRDAFAKNASRMGMMGSVDDDEGVVFHMGKNGLTKKQKPKLRWNRFKWFLFSANTVLIIYGMAALVSAILVWLNAFFHSDVIRVGNRTELIISTVAAAMIVLTSLIGYSGIILNNRAFLAIFTVFLWICLGLLVTPGYLTYKQKTFNLEGKINLEWSRYLGTDGRLRIQDALRCCGYSSPQSQATISPLCYSRSNLPGCKSRYLKLERQVLTIWFISSFALVPAHILIILAGLLCSNHITYRFGKGLTPKRYRLDMDSMAVIMDDYASQIAAQYGPELANTALRNFSSTSLSGSRAGSTTNLSANMAKSSSRLAISNSGGIRGSALYDPNRDSFDGGSRPTSRYFDSDQADRGDVTTRYGDTESEYDAGYQQPQQPSSSNYHNHPYTDFSAPSPSPRQGYTSPAPSPGQVYGNTAYPQPGDSFEQENDHQQQQAWRRG